MDRIISLSRHLTASAQVSSDGKNGESDVKLTEIPVVVATEEFANDPITYLKKCSEKYPDLFYVDRGRAGKYLVIADASMYEDILTFDSIFGNPQAPNMLVNKTIFQIPMEQLDKYEQKAISELRKFLLNNNKQLATKIVGYLERYMKAHLGNDGVMDLRDFGKAIFWPMTEALFGKLSGIDSHPEMYRTFEDIDNFFGKALKGREVPEVKAGVDHARSVFKEIAQCPFASERGPIIDFYDSVTKKESTDLTSKFATAAWWGGQGNTLPSTVWTFGLILSHPDIKKRCYEEADAFYKNRKAGEPVDFSQLPYMTCCLKEALRMTTYSIGWRSAQEDTTLTSSSGNTYAIPKGDLIGLHFALNHYNENIYDDPYTYNPDRFAEFVDNLSPVINGVKYAWVPFSAGRHKCSGYPLAMVEIPLAMALFFHEYDMEILDPLPGYNFQQAFGVIGPDEKPVRIKFSRRNH